MAKGKDSDSQQFCRNWLDQNCSVDLLILPCQLFFQSKKIVPRLTSKQVMYISNHSTTFLSKIFLESGQINSRENKSYIPHDIPTVRWFIEIILIDLFFISFICTAVSRIPTASNCSLAESNAQKILRLRPLSMLYGS